MILRSLTAPQIYLTFFRLEATKLEHNDALSVAPECLETVVYKQMERKLNAFQRILVNFPS